MEQLLAESAIDTLGSALAGTMPAGGHNSFRRLVEWIVAIDFLVPEQHREFFGSDTVLQGLSAAVGAAERKDLHRDRMWAALNRLRVDCEHGDAAEVLAVDAFNQLRVGFDVAKINVGQATREMVFHAFQEYFFSTGEKDMRSCWEFAASRS
jgi:hypothetical protein